MQAYPDHVQLVRQAVAGDRESLSALADVARGRVRAYLQRVMLDEDRAQDITQEVMVSMLGSLGQLRDPLRFWPWVFTIASNKVRQSFRRADLHTVPLSDLEETRLEPRSDEAGPQEGLSRLELAERTRAAMADLDVRHRMVLSMRFYEDLPHSAIGRALGCSEMSARVTFLRAKRALLRALRRRGVSEAALSTALLAFGQATLPARAGAIHLSVSALRESIRQLILSRCVPAAAAALLLAVIFWPDAAPAHRAPAPAPAPAALGIHFVEQSLAPASVELPFKGTRSQGAYEQWYQFPEGAGGPFFYRMQRWDPWQKHKLCSWVQNADANYYVFAGKRIHINNARLFNGSLRVETIPTDSVELCEFIRQMEEPDAPLAVEGLTTHAVTARAHPTPAEHETQRDPASGFLSRKIDHRFPELGPFHTTYDYAAQPSSAFNDPTGLPIVDERDEMHRRGWTWFRITGEIGDRRITGKGRLPLVYSAFKTHFPWLQLACEGGPELVDLPGGARVTGGTGQPERVRAYPAGSFFSGLARPWIGFHTLDVIRRDAAGQRIPFNTQRLDERWALIRLVSTQTPLVGAASSRVDLDRDLLEQIVLVADAPAGDSLARLRFEYLQEVAGLEAEFAVPATPAQVSAAAASQAPGPLWPLLLFE